ncbi:MAG TPA: PAS domain S-box protein [Phycisphaerae bacterium]|nr:PAS domain S-box protein [Phycisphaerae bacterium]
MAQDERKTKVQLIRELGALRERLAGLESAELELRRTQFALDHASVAVYWMGPDARFVYVNEGACRSLGYARGELLGMTVHDVDPDFPPEAWPKHWAELRRRRSFRFESRHRAKDGRIFPVEVTVNYVRFEGAEYNFAFAQDISPRKDAFRALRESEERFRSIVQSSPMGMHMYRLEADGRLVFLSANPAADRILGVDNGQFVGKDIEEAFPTLSRTDIPRRYRRICAEGGSWEIEQIDYEDERLKGAFEVHAFQTSPGTMATLFLDITDRRRAEAERQRLEEQLRHAQKMEAIGQLAGGVAHDFNNVLTAIQGNAELLKADLPAGAEPAGFVEEILKASRRAADLTRQLLAFARKGQLQTVPTDVHELIRDVAGILTHGIDRRIEVELDLRAESAGVLGDASQLQSALLNLGLNARDAMPEGGRLTFSTRQLALDEDYCRKHPFQIRPGPFIEAAVTDTGVGMDAEVRQRVFEPFFTTKKRGQGTGLGLASVYGCVKSHHGSIEVYSEPGAGTTFKVLLPLADAPEAEPGASPAPAEAPVRGSGHVLVVDDEEMVRSFAASALRGLGYTVSTCVDGAEAVSFYEDHHERIDLVVLDMIMPRLGGADTFRRLREIDPQAKVLLSSGFSHSGAADKLLRRGAVGFLHKPFRVEDLARAVAQHMRRDHKTS